MDNNDLKNLGFVNLSGLHLKEVQSPMLNGHTVTLQYLPKVKALYVTIPMVNENGHMYPYELTKMQGDSLNLLTLQNLIDWLEMSHDDFIYP